MGVGEVGGVKSVKEHKEPLRRPESALTVQKPFRRPESAFLIVQAILSIDDEFVWTITKPMLLLSPQLQ